MTEAPRNTEAPRSPQRLYRPSYALIYAGIVPVIQDIGRAHGYAVAVHGSMATDLDLLACPWVDDAADPEALIEAIRGHMGCMFFVEGRQQPEAKPHGRLAWSMHFHAEGLQVGGPYLDISVMPRATDDVHAV